MTYNYINIVKLKYIIIITLLIAVLGATYVYATNSQKESEQSETQITTSPTPDIQDLLLPDLRVLSPEELIIEYDEDGVKKLRFSSAFVNQGDGPLEMIGETDEAHELTIATQRIEKENGSIEEREVGRFVFHPDHEHWHTEKFTVFEIWSIDDNGEIGELINSTEKLSFCVFDEYEYDLNLENAPSERQYPGCAENEIQGISVGWSDIYEADIEGQEIDISNLINGDYIVRSIINPDENILERDYSNNVVTDHVNIDGDNVTKL